MDFSEKLNNLSQDLQDFFCSSQPRISLETACLLYDIREDEMEKITSLITELFFKDMLLKELPVKIMQNLKTDNPISYGIAYELNKNIFFLFPEYFRDAQQLLEQWEKMKCAPLVSEEKARRRLLDLEPWIEEEEKEKAQELKAQQKVQQEQERKTQASLDKLVFSEALRKYAKLGEQSITSNMIKLKYFPTPVKPSIKNWLTDYQDFTGANKRGAIERGNYIFHCENAKKLTIGERQKVSYLLRANDENLEVAVNVDLQNLVFDLEQQDLKTMNNFTPQDRGVPAGMREKTFATSFSPVQKPFPVQMESQVDPQETNKDVFKASVKERAVPFQNAELQKKAFRQNPTEKPISSQTFPNASSDVGSTRFNNMAPFGKTMNIASFKQPVQQPVKPESVSSGQQQGNSYGQEMVQHQENNSVKNTSDGIVLSNNTVIIKNKPLHRSTAEIGKTVSKFIKPSDYTKNPYDNEGRVKVQTKEYFEKIGEKQKFELKDDENVKANERVINQAIGSKVMEMDKKEEYVAPAGGKVSFSSPQNFTPSKSAPINRSPYRITPRGYEYNKSQD